MFKFPLSIKELKVNITDENISGDLREIMTTPNSVLIVKRKGLGQC